jgi:hypothetical protein
MKRLEDFVLNVRLIEPLSGPPLGEDDLENLGNDGQITDTKSLLLRSFT